MVNQFIPPNGLPSDTLVGDTGNTLGDIASQSAGAVQANGGDASKTTVTATGTNASRNTNDIAADTAHVAQFGDATNAATLVTADTALKAAGRTIVNLPPGKSITSTGEASDHALGDVLIYGDGSRLNNVLGFAAHDWYKRRAFTLPKSIYPRHLTKLHALCEQSNSDGTTIVKIVLAGDSILSQGDDPAVGEECAGFIVANAILEQLQGAYPNAQFEIVNRALGGTTWGSWNSSTLGAADYFGLASGTTLRDSIPTDCGLIIWNCGGNDGFGFAPADFVGSITYQASRCPNMSQVFVINSSSSIKTTNDETAVYGVQWAYSWILSYCQVYNYGYVDVDSWIRMRRDGYYPHAVSLDQISDRSSWFNSETLSGGWTFPDVKSIQGVSAANCTDWHVVFSCTTAQTLEIRLGIGATMCVAYLGVAGGTNKNQFTLAIVDGVSAERDLTSQYEVPAAPIIGITLKGNRLRIMAALPAQSQNGFDPANLSTAWSGGADGELGFFEIFNVPVVRWRTRCAPFIGNIPDGTKILNWAVADASTKNPTVMPVTPDVTMYGLYDNTIHAGGNGIVHMNAFGWRETILPPFVQQDWTPIVASGLSCSGVGAKKLDTVNINSVNCLRYGDNYHLDIFGGYMTDGANGTIEYDANRRAFTTYGGNFSWHSYDGSNWKAIQYLDPLGNAFVTGGFGAFGKSVTTQPKITGTAPTDPIVKQLLAALSAAGFVADDTTSS